MFDEEDSDRSCQSRIVSEVGRCGLSDGKKRSRIYGLGLPEPRTRVRPLLIEFALQGYLTYKKTQPPRTLP